MLKNFGKLSGLCTMQARRSMMTNNIVRSIRFTPILNIQSRFYSLERPEIETRIYGVLRAFSRASNVEKISPESTFTTDLGLDSLDTAEVLVAIEEEFEVEIPDKVADDIKTVGQAIDFIQDQAYAK